MRDSGSGLWRTILLKKYKIDKDGWRVPGQDYKASGIWKSILSVKVEFEKWIRYLA